jgi:hypothetical protein
MRQVLSFVRHFSVSAQPAVTTSIKFWEDCGVKWMQEAFQDNFLNLEVDPVNAVQLSVSKLERGSLDAQILKELDEKAEISVSHYREFLNQNRGTREVLITYLKGIDKNLWAVSAHWEIGQGGFSVAAHFVTDTEGCYAGNMILSRMPSGETKK